MEKKFVTKDSGARQEFGTGSVRDLATGKGRYDLIPTLPLRRLAGLYERGAAKYGDRNWEKGQPLMRYIDSMLRHANCLIAGEPMEDHAAAIAWNAFGFMFTLDAIENGRLDFSLDDRPCPEAQYAGTQPHPNEAPKAKDPVLAAVMPDPNQMVFTDIVDPPKRLHGAEKDDVLYCDDPECPFCPLAKTFFTGATKVQP